MISSEDKAKIISSAIFDYNKMILGQARALFAPLIILNKEQIEQLSHFAKQGVKVRLK